MSVATPKAQAKEPIQLDSLLVCRKALADTRPLETPDAAMSESQTRSRRKLRELEEHGFTLSTNDRRVAVMGQFLAAVCPRRSAEAVAAIVDKWSGEIDEAITTMKSEPQAPQRVRPAAAPHFAAAEQLILL